MRKGLGIVIGLLIAFNTLFAQNSLDINIDTTVKATDKGKKPKKILIISDGNTITQDQMMAIDRMSIYRVDVLKGKAGLTKYGEAAKNGVIVLMTKPYVISQYQKKLSQFSEEYKQYLYVKEHNDNLHPVLATYYINGDIVENEYHNGTDKLSKL